MSSEQVLFDDPGANITVTNERLIVGDDVIAIGTLSHARGVNTHGVKEYAIAIWLSAAGIGFVLSMSGWSILGLILLIYPYMVFFTKHWLVFAFTRGGGAVEHPNLKREFAKATATAIADAINTAVQAYQTEHDPRANLNLGS